MNKAVVIIGVIALVGGIAYMSMRDDSSEKPLGKKGKKQKGVFDKNKPFAGGKINVGGQKSGVTVTAPAFDPWSFISGIFGGSGPGQTHHTTTTATTAPSQNSTSLTGTTTAATGVAGGGQLYLAP